MAAFLPWSIVAADVVDRIFSHYQIHVAM